MKRFGAMLLVLCLLAGLTCLSALADETDPAAENTAVTERADLSEEPETAELRTETSSPAEELATALDGDADGEGETSVKDVYIDNTEDKSVSYVTGAVHITGSGGTQAGYDSGKTVYSGDGFAVTYSNPKTAEVQGAIDAAYTEVYSIAQDLKDRGKSGEFHMSASTSTGKVWDNRKYETIEDGDAVLIGDSDYLTGAYGVSDDYTRTHVASGDYGKETFYRVEANGWVAGFDVIIAAAEGGAATADYASALADTKVTVTLKAEDGWALGTAGVFAASDDHQISAVTYGDSGMTEDTLTFTMPKDDVEISASFIKLAAETTEPTPTPTPTPTPAPTPTTYAMLEGMNGSWSAGDPDLHFRADGAYDKFVGAKVDGAWLGEADYTSASGSTVVDLKAAYLETLAAGEHTLTVAYTDGEATTTFVKKAPPTPAAPAAPAPAAPSAAPAPERSPQTGDDAPVALWALILAGSAVGLGLALHRKRRTSC